MKSGNKMTLPNLVRLFMCHYLQCSCTCVIIFINIGYVVPYVLKGEYSKIIDRFSFVLNDFAEEVIKSHLLDKFKAFLLGRSFNQPEGKDDVTKVCNVLDLVSLLQKYFFVSNFGAIVSFAEEHHLGTSKKLSKFSEEIDELYGKILAKDFAQQAIEDHLRKEYHGEVRMGSNEKMPQLFYFLDDI